MDDFPRSGYAYETITASGIGCTFGILDPETLRLLLDNIDVIKMLTPDARVAVKEVFSRAYRTQFLVTVGFAAAQIPAAFLLLKRGRQIRAIEM